MSQARTNRRRARQLKMNNAHLSGMGVPKYRKQRSGEAKRLRRERQRRKAEAMGRSFGYTKKK